MRDHIVTFWRRRRQFWVPALAIVLLAAAAAVLLPPTYRSQATILVEESEVPQDLVSALVTDYLEKRLESITRRVMVTENLIAIIERYDLYPEERRRRPITEIVDDMRGDIRTDQITADVVDVKSGRTAPATIAFTLAFDHKDPETAQRVTNELVSLYLNENLRQRREAATQTATFLSQERQRLEAQIGEIENRFEAFKDKNNGALPEQLAYNQQMAARAEDELRDLDRQAQSIRDRMSLVGAQLAQTDPYQMFLGGGQLAPSPEAALESTQTELATTAARYGVNHPDVIRLRRELQALEAQTGSGRSADSLLAQRTQLQTELNELRQRYGEGYPDVASTARELANVNAALAGLKAGGGKARRREPDNPAYVQLTAQTDSLKAEMQAVDAQRAIVAKKLGEFEELLARSPAIATEHDRLQHQLDELNLSRDDLVKKEATAQLGQALETESKAERFSLIEPPALPTEPVKPPRTLIVLAGLVAAMGGGVGNLALRQMLDRGVHGSGDLHRVFGEDPLAVLPRIVTAADRRRAWSLRLAALLLVLAAACFAAWAIATYVEPLDVFYYDVVRRLETSLGDKLPWLFDGAAAPAQPATTP